jgi:2-polyprenyl-3-methyl-5-hydroxy-6-metoxy-1,4-benzoquinol methylase
MDPAIVRRLNEINKAFYRDFASVFAESRTLDQPELQRVVELVAPGNRVLDVGCGHGRIAHLLDRRQTAATYLGLDFSAQFVRLAEEWAVDLEWVEAEFRVVDLLDPHWSAFLDGQLFDVTLVLAVLHHIPAYANRLALMRQLRDHLAPGGRLVASTWQFTTHARMRRKIVSWDRAGLDPAGLEPGDYLLDWKRGGVGLRYCHLVDEGELERLARDSGLAVRSTFRAGGKEGDLSLFGILARP